MNFLGPELVRDLVSLIQQAEADEGIRVLVFKSADPEYFISHVDLIVKDSKRFADSGGLRDRKRAARSDPIHCDGAEHKRMAYRYLSIDVP